VNGEAIVAKITYHWLKLMVLRVTPPQEHAARH
jgi:hypothetical protein